MATTGGRTQTRQQCCFCHQGENPICGTFFHDEKASLAAHQFCLFFSAGLAQQGQDEEGFDGFLHKDIVKEAQRANKIICKFCQRPGASSGCCLKTCRLTYHFMCGINQGMQFVFYDCFDTYCKSHRSHQDLSVLLNKRLSSGPHTCPLCLEEVVADPESVLKTPCCKNIFLHKECVQTQANASGYFFRCPTCNNEHAFQLEMSKYGVYIPQRDAAWEGDNAFSDLLEQYQKCDSSTCQCPQGITHSTDDGEWCLLRCYHCGQSAVHRHCLGNNLSPDHEFVCRDCNDAIGALKSSIVLSPVRYDERYHAHKKLLAALKERQDPVLFFSPVFAPSLWRKKFNVGECVVVVRPLPQQLVSKIYRRKISGKWLKEFGFLPPSITKKTISRKAKKKVDKTRVAPITKKRHDLLFPSIATIRVGEYNQGKRPNNIKEEMKSWQEEERVEKLPSSLSRTAERILSCLTSPTSQREKRVFDEDSGDEIAKKFKPNLAVASPSSTKPQNNDTSTNKLFVRFSFDSKRKRSNTSPPNETHLSRPGETDSNKTAVILDKDDDDDATVTADKAEMDFDEIEKDSFKTPFTFQNKNDTMLGAKPKMKETRVTEYFGSVGMNKPIQIHKEAQSIVRRNAKKTVSKNETTLKGNSTISQWIRNQSTKITERPIPLNIEPPSKCSEVTPVICFWRSPEQCSTTIELPNRKPSETPISCSVLNPVSALLEESSAINETRCNEETNLPTIIKSCATPISPLLNSMQSVLKESKAMYAAPTTGGHSPMKNTDHLSPALGTTPDRGFPSLPGIHTFITPISEHRELPFV